MLDRFALSASLWSPNPIPLLTSGKGSHPPSLVKKLVERGGFEPPKASPTDLQSVPFGRSGTSPTLNPRFLIDHFLLVKKRLENQRVTFVDKGS